MNSGVTVRETSRGWSVTWTSHEQDQIQWLDITRILFRDLGLWEAEFCVHVNGQYKTLTVNSISYEQAPIALGEWLNDFYPLGVIVDQEVDAQQLKGLLDQRISWAILSNGRVWS